MQELINRVVVVRAGTTRSAAEAGARLRRMGEKGMLEDPEREPCRKTGRGWDEYEVGS